MKTITEIIKPITLLRGLHKDTKRPGVVRTRKRHYTGAGMAIMQSTILYPPSIGQDMTIKELSEELDDFKEAVKKWKNADSPYQGATT